MKIDLRSPDTAKFQETDGLYRKEVIKFGTYIDKYDRSSKMVLDRKMAEQMVANFEGEYNDIPLEPSHYNDDALKVLGWIRDLRVTDTGLDADMDVISDAAQEAINDGRIRNVSAGIIFNNVDNESGKETGARLEHVAAVPLPYLRGMKGFTKLSEEADAKTTGTKVYILDEEVKEDETPSVEGGLDNQKESDTIKSMNKVDTQPNEAVKAAEQDVDSRIEQLEAEHVANKAKLAYAELLSAGRISPAQKESFLGHAKSEDMIEAMTALFSDAPVSAMPKLNEEQGTQEVPDEKPEGDVELSEDEKATYEALGVSLEDIKEYGGDQ